MYNEELDECPSCRAKIRLETWTSKRKNITILYCKECKTHFRINKYIDISHGNRNEIYYLICYETKDNNLIVEVERDYMENK